MTRRPSAPAAAPAHRTLTLGGLFHDLRGGMGDMGSARVSIRFEQRASQGAVQGGIPTQLSKTSLLAELDFRDGVLHRADMTSTSGSSPAPLRVSFLAHEGGFLYSLDRIKFGRFVGPVVLFDLGTFEEMLAFVTVRDVTIDERTDVRGATLDVIDVDLDTEAFRKLLRIFGADTEETPEEFDLDSYSVSLAAGGDIVVDYWWQLSGEDGVGPSGQPAMTTVNCHVTLRVAAMTALPDNRVDIDRSLPLLTRVDDVWDIARARSHDNDC